MSSVSTLLDLLYPPRCPACDAHLDGHAALCGACEISLYALDASCPRCAEPLEGPHSIPCWRCHRAPPPFESITAGFRYGGQLAVALQRFKYQRRADIGRTLAPLFAPLLWREAERVDVIVPVPLHWWRMSRRGFNQSAVLVAEAARGLPLAVDTLSLRRLRATPKQTGNDARRRAATVAGAFAVPARRRRCIEGKVVLLADDVVTTGATMAEASRALLAAGARAVRGVCLARAEA